MKTMVFRCGPGFIHNRIEDGEVTYYPEGQLRTIALLDHEDELEAVQRYMSNDVTLREYVGLAEPGTFPANDSIYNARRCNGDWDTEDHSKNVGRKQSFTVDVAHAKKLHYRHLLGHHAMAKTRLEAQRDDALIDGEDDKAVSIQVKIDALTKLKDDLPRTIAQCQTVEELLAVGVTDLT